MKRFSLKIIKLFIGLFVVSIGVAFMINANVGLPPWDVLHSGISNLTGITIGQAIIIISFISTMIGVILGEKIGIGTICNVIFIGIFVDFIIGLNIIPQCRGLLTGFFMLNLGMIILGVGTVIYISCELCCGAKDAVTMGITKKINQPVKYVRSGIEIIVLTIGVIIGGKFTLMTIYNALFFGYFMQLSFKVLKCNPSTLKHKSIIDIFNYKKTSKEEDEEYIVDVEISL